MVQLKETLCHFKHVPKQPLRWLLNKANSKNVTAPICRMVRKSLPVQT
jgi:hypothetical protein